MLGRHFDANNDNKVQPEEKGAIKIADSFGPEHPTPQNKGFHWMTYSTFVHSIAENRVNRLILRENYSPKIICKITLNTAERDKIKFQFGRKSTKTKDLESIRLQAFDYKANQAKCVYVITSNFEKVRFYINNAVDF